MTLVERFVLLYLLMHKDRETTEKIISAFVDLGIVPPGERESVGSAVFSLMSEGFLAGGGQFLELTDAGVRKANESYAIVHRFVHR